MPRYHNKNGVRTQFTAEQETARDAEEARHAVLKLEQQAVQYKKDRREAYPSIGDQLDMMWHDKKNDTTTWEDAVQAVKDANPKP